MPHEVTDIEVKTIRTIHRFTCDLCGAEIGQCSELDDGYFKELGCVKMMVTSNLKQYKRYSKSVYLCTDCRSSYLDEMQSTFDKAIASLGFEEDDV